MERERSERELPMMMEMTMNIILSPPQVWREETVYGRRSFFFSRVFPQSPLKMLKWARFYRWARVAIIGPYEMMDRASSILFLFLIFYYLNAYLIYQVKFKC